VPIASTEPREPASALTRDQRPKSLVYQSRGFSHTGDPLRLLDEAIVDIDRRSHDEGIVRQVMYLPRRLLSAAADLRPFAGLPLPPLALRRFMWQVARRVKAASA